MATLQWDSELMTNYVSAVAVPAASHMVTCVDPHTLQPMIFALSNDEIPKLQVIGVNEEGQRVRTDYGRLLGLPTDAYIQTFDVQQGADYTIHLALTTKVDEQHSQLWVVRPFQLSSQPLLTTLPPQTFGKVHKIKIGLPTGKSPYPAVWVMHQPLNRAASGSDLARVEVKLDMNKIIVWKDCTLPTNVNEILDIATANGGSLGQGLYYLCRQSDAVLLMVKFVRPGMEQGDAPRWAQNNQDELGFLVASCDNIDNSRAATLLPAGKATSFSAAICKPAESFSTVKQILAANDESGNLTLLEQSLDTGIWRTEPFYVEEGGTLMAIPSYTVNMTALDDKKQPLCNGQVFIKSSSLLSATLNGRSDTLDPKGRWYPLDTAGELALIIPTNGLTSQPLQISKVRNFLAQEITLHSDMNIDPSHKVIKSLSKLDSTEKLEAATDKDGKSIWEGVEKPSKDELIAAAQCFSAIREACTKLPADGSVVQTVTFSALSVNSIQIASNHIFEAIADTFMDGFNYLKEKVHQTIDWIVRKAGEVWEFVCTIGNSVKKFVLDCIEKVTEAATWVWDKFKLGWEKLCDVVGFLFSWDDIIETKRTIKGLLNAGLDYAANNIEGVNVKIEDLFSSLQNDIAGLTGIASMEGRKGKLKPSNGSDDKQMTEFQQSPGSKWIGERMKNGSGSMRSPGKSKCLRYLFSSIAQSDPFHLLATNNAEEVKLWEDRIQPLLMNFTKVAEDLGKDLAELFTGDNNLSTGELLAKAGGDLLINIIDVAKKILQTLVTLVSKLVVLLKNIGNQTLTWGFVEDLYKWLNQGDSLTIFDAVSLIIAIPATFIIKIVTGRKPPTLGNMDSELFGKSVIGALRDSEEEEEKPNDNSMISTANKTTARDVTVIVLGAGCGAAVVSLFFKNIKFLRKAANKGISVAVDSLSPGTIMEVISICLDGFSIIKDLINAPDDETPGAGMRNAATYIKCFRLLTNVVYMAATKAGGLENELVDQIMLAIDLLTAMVNCGLYTAVYVKELDAKSWKGYDEGSTLLSGANTLLETVTAIGYFTAATFKEKAPHATLVGLGCMQIGAVGAIVTKGVEFRLTYKKMNGE
ncbi:uncharacterized protein N7482_001439 [Penicillium canariense]|uniref:Uncharacterized protein n=1 Tax=Penicillium canariense TaxID=189055 RepID=A0A9W9LU58_9EURO|nr:uncharacterized protein N7482_001439 [Penicillium canariense]KAJ5175562.1 hypothetical protein N7482_001439 [Penicillium canariense]